MPQIINITNPGAQPADGDILQHTHENGAVVKKQFHIFDTEETPESARAWRNQELFFSDSISQTPDHPERTAYLAYRVALRDWPATGDFPDTKPELGS